MRNFTRSLGLFGWLLGLMSGAALAQDASPESFAFFENEIRPLLVDHCIKCHGPKKAESGLRLDAIGHIRKGGDSGPAISTEKPGESLVLKAIRHEDGLEMPPEGHLNEHQIASVSRWIEQGAAWPAGMKLGGAGPELRSGPVSEEERAFWSFQPITDPVPPVVEASFTVKNPIDQFVAYRLHEAGLTMRSPADKRTLLRRATFDLTGLPPTPAEVAAFLADDSPEAFERVVDRLLSSPEYGERWGRHWMDVVRYADTAGETADYPTPLAYKYRNWIIQSVNSDLPYDEFLREQIAGDILGQRMLDQLGHAPNVQDLARYQEMVTATGFIAISRRFGFDIQNYHHLTIQDTIDTVGQAVLGLTLGCARCHDHKFDPVSLQDYYAWYGIFESTKYSFPGSEEKKRPNDLIPNLPPAIAGNFKQAFEEHLAQMNSEIELLKAEIETANISLPTGGFDGFEGQTIGQPPGAPYNSLSQVSTAAEAQSPFENVFPKGTRGFSFPSNGNNNAFGRVLAVAHTPQTSPVLYYNIDFRNTGVAAGGTGAYRFYLGHGPGPSPAVEMGATATGFSVRNGENYEQICELHEGEWYNLQVNLDLQTKTYSGALSSAGETVPFSAKAFTPRWDGTIDNTFVDKYGFVVGVSPARDIDNLAISKTPFLSANESISAVPNENLQAIEKQLSDWKARLAELQKQKAGLESTGPYEVLYGATELDAPKDAAIQLRGEPLKRGAVVPRKNLEILGNTPLPTEAGSGRLEMANWLTDPDNPLTARVMVNRIWQQHFGKGIVSTENDFGARGDRPTHPELLDWLASRLIQSGWSLKSMHRLIMASATYQQASTEDTAALEKDPSASLMWRFNPRRLSAEEIRDAMLVVSDTLDSSQGGEHPFPPAKNWGFTQHNPYYAVYPSSKRSVYLMQQRLKRHPFLGLFDGADTNASTPHRQLTTVPTQALFLMNNDFVHASSKSLANRLEKLSGSEVDKINEAYALTLNRPASEQEIHESQEFLRQYESALASLGQNQGPSAAWGALMRTLLIRNEFLFLN